MRLGDEAEQVDYGVGSVDGDPGHGAGRRLARIGAPVAGLDGGAGARRLLADAGFGGAKGAVAHAPLHLLQGRMEAAVEADRQHDAGFRGGVHRAPGVVRRQRKRLFAEHVLAGRCGAPHLVAMLAVRRRQHYRVDVRIGQRRLIVSEQLEPVLAAELLHLGWRARGGGDERYGVALALYGSDQRLAPPAGANDCGTQHMSPWIAVGLTPDIARMAAPTNLSVAGLSTSQ